MKKKAPFRLSLYVKFTLIVMAGLLLLSVCIGAAATVMQLVFDVDVQNIFFSDNAWLVLCSLFIGGTFAGYIGKKFFDPITRLGKAMSKVAKGDFSIELDSKSKIKEVQEIYTNFNLMVKELRATEILQTDFVSNVSHEFKTPVTAIEGYATLLQDSGDPLSSQQEQYVEKILFNSKRVSALVDNVLLLSRIDNQAIPPSSSGFRLDEQIRQAVFALEPEWSKKSIDFDVDLDAADFTGNEALIQQVFSNLIGNAVKFSPEGGTVRLRLEKNKSDLCFTIEDQGPGIPEEGLSHIFDKFYQADASRKQEGNGLGLALVKKILTVSGGSIFAENLSPSGCRFTVLFPILNKN